MLTTTQDIITWFETLIGDATELSSEDELTLLQETYDEVLRFKEWEFLKKEATGSISGTDITQPTDFDRLCVEPVIYLGDKYNPHQVIPFTERRAYVGQNMYFYYDARQEKFVSRSTKDTTYSFDYIYTPPALNVATDGTASAPVFPNRFWYLLAHKMATSNDIINLSEKARSYAQENNAIYNAQLNNLATWSDSLSLYRSYGSG